MKAPFESLEIGVRHHDVINIRSDYFFDPLILISNGGEFLEFCLIFFPGSFAVHLYGIRFFAAFLQTLFLRGRRGNIEPAQRVQ